MINWLFPLFLIFGLCLTRSFSVGYLIASLSVILSYRLLVPQLRAPLRQGILSWITLFLFVFGYFGKFFLSLLMPAELKDLVGYQFDVLSQDNDLMDRTFWLMAFGFCAFAVASFFLSLKGMAAPPSPGISEYKNTASKRGRLTIFFWIMLALCVATAYIQFHYNIGVMGQDLVVLPYRLNGFVYYTRLIFIPCLLIFAFYRSDGQDLKRIKAAFLILLIAHALTQSLLTSSRGQLILMMLPLFFLYLLQGKMTGRQIMFFVFVLLFTLFNISLFTHMRYFRINYGAQNIVDALLDYRPENGLLEQMWEGLLFAVMRITGVDGTIISLTMPPPSFSIGRIFTLVFSDHGLSDYFTHNVAGVGNAVVGYSPGLVGGMYVLDGYWGVALGIPLWMAFWSLLWKSYLTSRSKNSFFVLSTIATYFLFTTQEGCIDISFKIIAIMLFSIWVCEKLSTHFIERERKKFS